jgi:protein TonB
VQPPTAAVKKAKTAPAKAAPSAPAIQPPSAEAQGLNNKAPLYPQLSRKKKEQGTVLLLILVKADGTVSEIKLKTSSGFTRLDQAARQAVKRWQFQPALKEGQPIDFWYELPLKFSLNQS